MSRTEKKRIVAKKKSNISVQNATQIWNDNKVLLYSCEKQKQQSAAHKIETSRKYI